MVDTLLEQEAGQQSRGSDGSVDDASRINAIWRKKVIYWYFSVVGALRRQHSSAATNQASNYPFSRASVYVSVSLLDSYLMGKDSLPHERAIRYKHDRQAYQLLATTCLLLGMRLAHRDSNNNNKESSPVQHAEDQKDKQCTLKRASKCLKNMNEASTESTSTVATTSGLSPAIIPIPNAAAILRISAAPRTLSEHDIVGMLREMSGSRAFPKSRVVTALDFIHAISATSTDVSQDGNSIVIGPQDVEKASRLMDTLLTDVNFISSRPSVLACALITLALTQSNSLNSLDMASIRQKVYYSIFGPGADPNLQAATLKAEAAIQQLPASRNNARRVVLPILHLIPDS